VLLIISESLDNSTNHVIDWVLRNSHNIIRVNKYDLKIESVNYENNEIIFKYKNLQRISNIQIKA
jgi:hypothetical protein